MDEKVTRGEHSLRPYPTEKGMRASRRKDSTSGLSPAPPMMAHFSRPPNPRRILRPTIRWTYRRPALLRDSQRRTFFS